MEQLSLFNPESYVSQTAARVAAIDYFNGDKAKADAIINDGNFIFLKGVVTAEQLGKAVACHITGKKLTSRSLRNWALKAQGEDEVKATGGKFTPYGFFCLKNGRGVLARHYR